MTKYVEAFSLTLTLSRWERGQQPTILHFSSVVRQIQSEVFEEDGERFSLSQRERAGVRESG